MTTEHKYAQEFGDGWVDLVNDALEKILSIDSHYEVLQIKEKFGELRWYGTSSYEYGTPNAMLIGRIVKDAESRSVGICESCGLPGEMRVRNHWYFTSCDKHAGDDTVVVDD
jgi:hypothetical protein